MSFSAIQDADERERAERRPIPRQLDAVSEILGSGVYIRSHRTALQIEISPGYLSSRITVSRYYFQLEPPVAVDFLKEIRSKRELEAKRAYFDAQSIRYVVTVDEWDGEAVEAAITEPAGDMDTESVQRPVTAPRR